MYALDQFSRSGNCGGYAEFRTYWMDEAQATRTIWMPNLFAEGREVVTLVPGDACDARHRLSLYDWSCGSYGLLSVCE
jgi:hypothetical protein